MKKRKKMRKIKENNFLKLHVVMFLKDVEEINAEEEILAHCNKNAKKKMTTHFKPITPFKHYNDDGLSEEQKYWMLMEESALFEESCSSCDFKPCPPYSLAIAGGNRVIVFDTTTAEPISIYSRFKTSLCSVKYRHDGALLGVSTENGFLQFFDTHSEKPRKQGLRTPIRTIKAHKSQIYSFQFDLTGYKVASFSDDCYTKLFDLAIENSSPIWSCGAHTDFIRTGGFVTNSDYLLATGSYDQTIRLWDTRQDGSSFVREFNHGLPVEKLLFIDSQENLFVSSGGPLIKFWDLNSGQMVKELKIHKKMVTSLSLSKDNSFLLTGSTDRRLNVVKLDNFDLVNTWRFDAPIKTLAIDPLDKHFAFGLGNNNFAIWKRKEEVKDKNNKKKRTEKQLKKKLKKREEEDERRPKGLVIFKKEREGEQERVEIELTQRQLEQKLDGWSMQLGDHDYLLREGRVQELVSTVLTKLKEFSLEYIFAVFHQIRIRQQLKLSLSELDRHRLCILFEFLSKNISNKQFFDILYDVINTALEIYFQKPLTNDVRTAIQSLQTTLTKEIEKGKEQCQNFGLFEMLKNSNRIKINEQNFEDDEEESEEEEKEEINNNEKGKEINGDLINSIKTQLNGKINNNNEEEEEDSEEDDDDDNRTTSTSSVHKFTKRLLKIFNLHLLNCFVLHFKYK
ncbi:RNA helicase [Meloidogyne graminicola]|uniref:U3 small nucleolar RNA-associated protein 15 homolog n=1 Tax=Meloidogyne graminicola TaxID=189291 RepID=A0A8T0A1H0_9BILA|nr:RNA helicase [Meloidogyne graminicola]